jgi:hypothetical protein
MFLQGSLFYYDLIHDSISDFVFDTEHLKWKTAKIKR